MALAHSGRFNILDLAALLAITVSALLRIFFLSKCLRYASVLNLASGLFHKIYRLLLVIGVSTVYVGYVRFAYSSIIRILFLRTILERARSWILSENIPAFRRVKLP